MKIALVCPYDFAYPGGVVNHVNSLYKELKMLGHDVRIIAPASKSLVEYGTDFIQVGKPRPLATSGTVVRISLSVNLKNRIKKVLAEEKFDVIHLHEPFMIMLCSAMLRFSKTCNVATFHASQGKPGYNLGWPFTRIFLRRRRRNLHGHMAVSNAALRFASKYIPGEYTIVPNGIDLDLYHTEVQPFSEYIDDKLNILFVGRMESRKGLGYLIDAYAQIKPLCPQTRLLIVGPGTPRQISHYRNMVKKHGLSDVVFVGGVSCHDLPRYYKTAHIYCSPATGQESFGIVLLEAMALGVPIVASRIEGYQCVLTDNKEGLFVPPKNADELAKTLIKLITHPDMRSELSAEGLKTVQQYSWKMVAKKVEEYYHLVLSKNHHGPEGK
ncbi:glycosyltransferase family 4 protein [Dehalococcoides mccartyi]|uniref:Glycosyl transferase, group 1 family protein n=1 Tax=Dehalococcoides mccartyi (strain CBDB1) TaxID=255470 RepID=A0A916NVA6_DEHMC|nr:glycosyltransferase family 4 protein [Dehalococcoides mccartyi]CAI83068.1 glycosyl transferase, group 1 family protein [Dehalococcoides mccartyi CBDB1]